MSEVVKNAADFDKTLTYKDIHGEEQTLNYRERILHSEACAIAMSVRRIVFSKQFGGYAPFMRDIAFYHAMLNSYTDLDPEALTPDILDMYINGIGGANLLHLLLEAVDKAQLAQIATWTDDMIEYEKKKDGMAMFGDMVMDEMNKTEEKPQE